MALTGRNILGWLLVGGAFLALCGLGGWQLQRAAWKSELIARITAAEAAPPQPIGPDPAAQEWHKIVVSGVFHNDKALRLTGAIRDGRPGTRLILPLERDGAPMLLVDRGFVGMGEAVLARDTEPVTITGRLRLPYAEPPMGPFNQPDLDVWYRIDPPTMARYRELPDVAPYYVEEAARPGDAGDLPPVPGYAAADLPNNHLQYAATWFSLAVLLLILAAVRARSLRSHDVPNPRL